MDTTGFSNYIFWSYKRNANLPEEQIIKRVIVYGEISDFILPAKKSFRI
ncbi:hypothetical protein MNBD_BACTEROID01-1889 [hydrothermal vent metagenome]|uniref:Uncharacterized protein n=1 Tax=hydrothermal vent metagenome TaxID=652676 RepID=A0A3B0TIT2_9ZZZZ